MSTLNEKKQMLKSIPIAYYLGHPLEVVLDEKASTSFINLKSKTINIAASQVVDGDLQLTRSSVYHELSHALFTPADVFDIASSDKKDFVNIFEDWRIETKAANYFLEIDFKRNVFAINHTTSEAELSKPLTAQYYPQFIDFFYAVLRYGILKKTFSKWLDKIFSYCKKINSSDSALSGVMDQCFNIVYNEILDFYEKYIKNRENEENEAIKQRREEQLDDEKQQQQQQENAEGQPQQGGGAMGDLQSIFKNIAIVNNDPLIDRELEKIINLNSGKASGSATYAFNGANFNVRKYVDGVINNNMQRAFKSFEKPSNSGSLKKSKITRLIVIQDISNSYRDNAAVTAGVYRALYDFQKKHNNQFKLEVIASGCNGYDITYKRARGYDDVKAWMENLECSSGLRSTLEDYIPAADPRYDDFFLILFDGKITRADRYLEAFWRDRKTFVISDDQNKFFNALKQLKNTNEVMFIESRNYALSLFNNVKKILNKIR